MTETDALIAQITAQIDGQNWTDEPLTSGEKTCIEMAVRATLTARGPAAGEVERLREALGRALYWMETYGDDSVAGSESQQLDADIDQARAALEAHKEPDNG